mmetsp:Transcript_73744/g.162843  ORF Transcript_73744/g.162843 Transcript_73744/m.162843 type:complete len:200 (+) Transcript_73744:305-904(+)
MAASGGARRVFGACPVGESSQPLWGMRVATLLTLPMRKRALVAPGTQRLFRWSMTLRRSPWWIFCGGFGRHTIPPKAWARATTGAPSTAAPCTILTRSRSSSTSLAVLLTRRRCRLRAKDGGRSPRRFAQSRIFRRSFTMEKTITSSTWPSQVLGPTAQRSHSRFLCLPLRAGAQGVWSPMLPSCQRTSGRRMVQSRIA